MTLNQKNLNTFNLKRKKLNTQPVAVTDLFSLANQCPRQTIRPHTDQPGAECIDSFFLSRIIFLALFGSHDKSKSTQLAAKKDLSPMGIPHGRSSLKSALQLAAHTEEPALRPVTKATCYSDTPPTN